MKRIFYTLLLVSLVAACKTVKIDRSITPVPAAAPEIQLGSYETFELDNGLKVIVVQNSKLPRVSYRLSVDRGPIFEEKSGTAGFAGSLMSAGTTSMEKAELDETVDFMGASLNTFSTGASASCLSKHKEKMIELMADVVLNPVFPEEELAKEQKRTLSGLASSKTDPNTMSSNITSVMNYGKDHPYGQIDTEESIESVTQADLKSYYNTYFKPNISYLVIVGDITLEEAKRFSGTYFGAWEKGDVPKVEWEQPLPPTRNKVAFVPLAGAVQSVIDITFPVDLKPGSPDEIACSVMNNILGGGTFSGRLFQNLREDKAYTYGAYSSLSSDRTIGSFSASASVRNEVTDSAITEMLFEIRRMIKDPVPDSTLRFMKNWMTGTFALRLESPQTIANYALNIERYGLPKDYYQTYLTRLEAVTSADLQRVAKQYLKPNNAHITVVGSKDEVAEKLASFGGGEVAFYDMFGDDYVDRMPAPEGVTIDTVLADFISARGGEERLTAINNYSGKGTMNMGGMSMNFTSMVKDNEKMKLSVEFSGMVAMEQIFDGENGKIIQMGAPPMDMDEQTINQTRYNNDILFEARLADYNVEAELLGMEEIEGKPVYTAEFRFPDGTTRTDYFSAETGLRLKEVSVSEGPDGVVYTTETNYLSYTEVEGVKFASKIKQVTGPQVVDITYSEVKTNQKMKDSEFKLD